ncbi:MAG: hypothetical protein ABFS56_20075 [Pseudomonadota bacterium]
MDSYHAIEGVYHALLFNFLVSLARFLITGCSQQGDTQPKGSDEDASPSSVTIPPDNGTRLALLIGNGDYDENANKLKLGALDNPVNDASDGFGA